MAQFPNEAFEYPAELEREGSPQLVEEYRMGGAGRSGYGRGSAVRSTGYRGSAAARSSAYQRGTSPRSGMVRDRSAVRRNPAPRRASPERLRPPRPRPYPWPVPQAWPVGPVDMLNVSVTEPSPSSGSASSREYTSWLQSALNQVMQARLPVTGSMNQATRDAVRDFQRREQLPPDGYVGPDTERALVEARRRMANADGGTQQQPGGGEPPVANQQKPGGDGTGNTEAELVLPQSFQRAAALVVLAPLVAPTTAATIANALAITKAISRFHGMSWRLGYTLLEHEGGVHLFNHHDGVMQTTSSARRSTIPSIPRPLKLALLGLPTTDATGDAVLNRRLAQEFGRRLAVQIATGIQELKSNLDRFNGYVALAFQSYNAGPGWAYFTVTRGKRKQRPPKIGPAMWEEMCRFGASLLHQLPKDLQIDVGMWQCDANIPTWFSSIPVRDRQIGLSLVAYKYLRSIPERIRKNRPAIACDWAHHGASHKQPGTGDIVSRQTRAGALDKLYHPDKLGKYYDAARSDLAAIPEDFMPLKVIGVRLVKMPLASGQVTPIPV